MHGPCSVTFCVFSLNQCCFGLVNAYMSDYVYVLQVSDPVHSGVLKFLFVRSFEPYSEFIRSWIYKAKFSDPYNEFIVECPDSLLHHEVGSTGVSDNFALATIRVIYPD